MRVSFLIATFILALSAPTEAQVDSPLESIDIPVKTIQFMNRATQEVIPAQAYSLALDMKLNCVDPECKKSSGIHSSTSEVSIKGAALQTIAAKIPRMPKSGPLNMTFTIRGFCKINAKCTSTMSFQKFMTSAEPVVFQFDVDAAKPARAVAEVIDWKKIESEVSEDRKKATPQIYSEVAITKLNLTPLFCTKELSAKIAACEFYSCPFLSEVMGVKMAADIIVHGTNTAGNCAITGPVGKRYFVPKSELAFFYDVMMASLKDYEITGYDFLQTDSDVVQKYKNTIQFQGAACVINLESKKDKVISESLEPGGPLMCKERKIDLLYQLELKNLSRAIVPVKVGFPKDGL